MQRANAKSSGSSLAAKAEVLEALQNRTLEIADPKTVLAYVQDLKKLLDQSSIMEQREFLKSFVEKVDVSESQVKVDYRIPLPGDLSNNGVAEGLPVLSFIKNGSPMHLTLRKWVWAWFKFPPSVARSRLPSTKLLRRNPVALAIEWQERLDKGAALTRADLAYQTKVTRAHVTQVLSLLDLAPDARAFILGRGDPLEGKGLGIHSLRSLLDLSAEKQIARVRSSKIG